MLFKITLCLRYEVLLKSYVDFSNSVTVIITCNKRDTVIKNLKQIFAMFSRIF